MNKTLKVMLIFLLALFGGYLIYHFFDLTIAGYIVTVFGAAVGIIKIFINNRGKADVESKVKIGRTENTKITGVDYSGKSPVPTTKSEVEIEKIKGGEVTGVRSK